MIRSMLQSKLTHRGSTSMSKGNVFKILKFNQKELDFFFQISLVRKSVYYMCHDVVCTYVGSLAKFRNRQTFSIEPFSSKSCLKNLAVSMFTCKYKAILYHLFNCVVKCSKELPKVWRAFKDVLLCYWQRIRSSSEVCASETLQLNVQTWK